MQSLNELTCSECDNNFQSAALLLQHFAMHASEIIVNTNDPAKLNSLRKPKKPNIPDLYPINLKEIKLKKLPNNFNNDYEKEENGDSGVEDLVNPLKYCLVTLDETPTDKRKVARKYECSYCSRSFGWSTDLKRHILTHTGERPFQCHICDSRFTRNFLLQKHQLKQHPDAIKIPQLKPINKQKSRKQEKSNIKRKILNKTKQIFHNEVNKNELISF